MSLSWVASTGWWGRLGQAPSAIFILASISPMARYVAPRFSAYCANCTGTTSNRSLYSFSHVSPFCLILFHSISYIRGLIPSSVRDRCSPLVNATHFYDEPNVGWDVASSRETSSDANSCPPICRPPSRTTDFSYRRGRASFLALWNAHPMKSNTFAYTYRVC